ncbi:putative Ankyrin repeats (3 copies) Ankyrin repeat [Trypanosoma vivax]|uniref:Ankyrin repeat protein n=1 Tax=Trypanosoma vivax (strain Y486) TaxID=1055687 RepID=G0U4S3_TRYVY|nr:hypothetical protein TRVL_02737 [Trypanosoma vivax]KAH8612019.1 putative Ankyrin repeats (3 copies) Ankyrin repeat [Trypanosoma vivax]CCC52438.1 conserved hypothetical protein [Trypanosoma vivax Y486]
MPKGGGKVSGKGKLSDDGSTLFTQFWNCLKKCDVDGLEEMLQDLVEDPETGNLTPVIKWEVASQLVNKPNARKAFPLSYAVSQGMSERGLHILLRSGANIDAADATSEKSTALHTACWGEDHSAVGLLLRCGANPLVTDARGRTPLHILASLNATSLFSYFLGVTTKKGVDTNHESDDYTNKCAGLEGCEAVKVSASEIIGQKDVAGFTVLHTAFSDISGDSDGVVSEVLNYLESLSRTDPAAVTSLVNITTEMGCTALYHLISCRACNESVMVRAVERLLALGASTTVVNSCNQTLFTVVVMSHTGYIATKLLRLLFDAVKSEDTVGQLEGVFLRCDTEKGYALIHHAIAAGNIDAVKFFIEFLKDVDASSASQYAKNWLGGVLSDNNETVSQLLLDYGYDEMAELLISANIIDKYSFEKQKAELAEAALARDSKRVEDQLASRGGGGKTDERDEYYDEEQEEEEEEETSVAGKGSGARPNATKTGHSSSRIQQARKARAHASLNRKKSEVYRSARMGLGGPSPKNGLLSLCVALVLLLVFLLLAMRLFSSTGVST